MRAFIAGIVIASPILLACKEDGGAANPEPSLARESGLAELGPESADPTSLAALEPCEVRAFTRHADVDAVCESLAWGDEPVSCIDERVAIEVSPGGPFEGLWLVCQAEVPLSECAVAVVTRDGTYSAEIGTGRSSMGTWSERTDVENVRVGTASVLGGPVLQFELAHASHPKDPELTLIADSEPAESVDEREQWICVAGATPACWAWTVRHELREITVREGEPEDPEDIPQIEVVRIERADWTRSVTLDLDAGTARLLVAKGAVGHPVDGPEQCRLDPSAAPPRPLESRAGLSVE
jgi:hypothetical protein